MSKAKIETKMDSFQSWAHRWGRVGTLIALIYMVALPFVVLAAYDSIPSLGEVFNVNTSFPSCSSTSRWAFRRH